MQAQVGIIGMGLEPFTFQLEQPQADTQTLISLLSHSNSVQEKINNSILAKLDLISTNCQNLNNEVSNLKANKNVNEKLPVRDEQKLPVGGIE